MLSQIRIAGFLTSVLAVAALAGCATAPRNTVVPVTMQRDSPDRASIAGVWTGEVWELPTHYIQGVRRVRLTINRDGSWTATSGDKPCASGTATVHGGLVVLAGSRTGPDYCLPYSVVSKDGRMRAVFDTSFKAREASAMVDLRRIEPAPAVAAEARTQP
ncbi:MAG TPA: hypothetical protein VIF11_12805 [Methylomirabilota bacterium]|jgi:hypothetical protein